jgi:hypothetical protein
MNKKTATIKIDPRTRDLLKKLGTKGETYDDVILRSVKYCVENFESYNREIDSQDHISAQRRMLELISLAEKED